MDYQYELGGAVIPLLTQYLLRIRSNMNIACQFGRLDTTWTAMTYYAAPGYAE